MVIAATVVINVFSDCTVIAVIRVVFALLFVLMLSGLCCSYVYCE